MRRARAFSLCGAAIAAIVASRANAQPSPDDVKRADALFRSAQALLDAGRIHDACEQFADSERLDPQLGTLLNLADCHAQEGKTATAHAEFVRARAIAAERGDKKREGFAAEQVAELEKRLAYARVDAPPDVSVTIDGRAVERAPIALDPGAHTVIASASGKKTRTIAITIAQGPGTQVVKVDPLDDDRPDAPIATSTAPPIETPPPPASDSRKTLGFVALGVGVVGVGLGTFFGLSAKSKQNDGDAHCSGKFCDATGLALQSDAHSAATLSTIAFAVGALGLGAGAYLVLSAPSASSPRATMRVGPVLTTGGGALRFEGSF